MHAVFLPGRVNSVHAWFDSVALQNMLLLAENFTLKSSFQYRFIFPSNKQTYSRDQNLCFLT